jgi:glutamate-1-semialdehyde 2,1-aminomutase
LAGGIATAFRAAQLPVPITFVRGVGARIVDIDGNEYVDFALAFGPLLLGHSPEPVIEAVARQLETGLGFGASHELESALAEAVCRTVPSAELCVFATTGSEAVHTAVRLARATTGRTRVIKFLGHYHGWYDSIYTGVPWQLDAGPGTGGQDPLALASVEILPWNDLSALEEALDDGVAAVIMEPFNANGGCLPPAEGYLEAVRDLTERVGAALIFDEVITGYRLALGGAQAVYGVTPDLTVLGKAIGAGFPLSAVCGRREWMEAAANGTMGHVGTFNANPICAAAALAAIEFLESTESETYPRLEASSEQLVGVLLEEGRAAGLPLQARGQGGVAHAFFAREPIDSYAAGCASDREGYRRFAYHLLREGVHVIPRGLLYLSVVHGPHDFDDARLAIRRACNAMAATAMEPV